MALIKCPECGREVSDKAVSFPGCGYPIQDMVQDNRSDLDKLVDEIWKRNLYSKTNAIIELQKSGVDLKSAKKLMNEKFNSNEAKQVLKEKKSADKEIKRQNAENFKEACQTIQNTFGGPKVAKCPKCHSTSISYDTKKFSFGRALVGDALAGPTGAILGGLSSKKGYAVCLKCGKRWKI